jgi:hypothetical protein
MDSRDRDAPLSTDPLDATLDRARSTTVAPPSWWARSRLALGLSLSPLPGLLLPVGIALGPHGLQVLSPRMLSLLDPVVSVALAALGVLIGLGLDLRRHGEGHLLGAASVESGLTMLVVGFGVLAVGDAVTLTGLSFGLAALLLGICASTSATRPPADPGEPAATIARLGDLDDVLPILAGGVALALMREPSPAAAAWLTVQAIGLALATAAAGRALAAQASSDAEERVFTIGTVMLLGGIAEFLSLSALLAGLVAGTFWTVRGGDVLSRISRDIRHIQHPLVVLLLLIAGARITFSVSLGALALAYVTLRALAKVGGGWLVARIGRSWALPSDLGLHLMSPGVIAVAFALNAGQASDAALSILTIVVVGSMASELLALLVRPAEGPL